MNGTDINDSMEQVVVYLRISEDRTGAEAGVERQRQDCLDLCHRLGVLEPVVFMDNDISAYGNKKRPGYLELLERVKLGPTRIVAWHVDRLYRKPRELEDLIDLVESHPIRIDTVKGGAFDLNAHEGRLMARQLVAIASYESGHKADRIRRANRQKAERGEWHGAPKCGYGLGGVLIPEEAAVIREMADRFLAGQSVRQITMWLNRDGGPTPPSKGKSRLNIWHASTVKSILCSARISGQRAYEPTAPRGGEPQGGRAILGPGNWEAIITPEETERIRAVFANPDRRVGRSAKSMLAGIISCGKCGNTLVTGGWRTGQTAPSKQHFYRCLPLQGRPERGGLSASAAGVEAVVTEAIAHAETQAARWEQAATAITKLRQAHAAEGEEHKTVVTAAEEHTQQVRDEVTAPLVAGAMADGQAVLTAQQAAWDAGRAYQQAGRFRRRSAARIHDEAIHAHERLQTDVQQRWGTLPQTPESLDTWAHTVAEKQAAQHPAVIEAEREAHDARAAGGQLARRQFAESQQLRARIYGKTGRAPEGGPAGRAARWRNQAKTLARALSEIETLPTVEVAQLIRQRHAEAEARRVEAERARAERAKQITSFEHEPRPHVDPHRERGIGY